MTFVLLIYFSVVIIERQSKLALYMHFMLLLACERENELQKKRVLTCYKKNTRMTCHTSQQGRTLENIAGF